MVTAVVVVSCHVNVVEADTHIDNKISENASQTTTNNISQGNIIFNLLFATCG